MLGPVSPAWLVITGRPVNGLARKDAGRASGRGGKLVFTVHHSPVAIGLVLCLGTFTLYGQTVIRRTRPSWRPT